MTEWLLIFKGLSEALRLAMSLAEQSNGEPPTQEQIDQIKQARQDAEDAWADLRPRGN
jgi:hypothetical protein